MELVVCLWILVGTLLIVPVVVALEVEGESRLSQRVTRMWMMALSTVTSVIGGDQIQRAIEFLVGLW